jgi:hypothetical protein
VSDFESEFRTYLEENPEAQLEAADQLEFERLYRVLISACVARVEADGTDDAIATAIRELRRSDIRRGSTLGVPVVRRTIWELGQWAVNNCPLDLVPLVFGVSHFVVIKAKFNLIFRESIDRGLS